MEIFLKNRLGVLWQRVEISQQRQYVYPSERPADESDPASVGTVRIYHWNALLSRKVDEEPCDFSPLRTEKGFRLLDLLSKTYSY